MVRLETVEDFEKVRDALNDPQSRLCDYLVREFGYCISCGSVTDYTYDEGGLINRYIVCLSCQNMSRARFLFTGNVDIPFEAQEKIRELHSRERQREFFQEALEEFIKKHKARERQVRNETRQLAKLRR